MKHKITLSILFCLAILINMVVFLQNKEKDYLYNEKNLTSENEINNLLSFYLQSDVEPNKYTSSSSIPSQDDNYIFSRYECNNEATISFNNSDWTLEVSNIKKGLTKCSLYFDLNNIKNYILSQNKIETTIPTFTGPETYDKSGYLFKTDDNDGISYYYRGLVLNNYFYFGGFYWRIIRINGDGTLRLIYQGTSASSTGTGAQIATSNFNNSYNDNAYEDYMYGNIGQTTYDATHTNTNDSTIKGIIDNWYDSNLLAYAKYIDGSSGFCNDRKIATTSYSGHGTTGYGGNATSYAPAERVWGTNWSVLTTETPTLKCSQGNDLFTMNNSSKGNKALTKPIGLITIDEVMFAGAFIGNENNKFYLYTGQNYWTMSPGNYDGNNARAFSVANTGDFKTENVNVSYGVRPVINLKADIALSGSGTASNPYTIK